jgi:predicted GNAT superfamily acetyltransferase
MTPGKRKKRGEIKITIGPFRGLADYETCSEIQREVWRCEDIDIVPVPLLVAANRLGGFSLGAYNSLGELIGFCWSLPGSEHGELFQHSHMLAVRAAYRNFDVGYKLKLAQRKETLRRKLDTIVWTFDPMQPLNAYFSLGKLGARAGAYFENFYGQTTSALHRGLPTDRFQVRWDLKSPQVKERLDSGPPRRDLRKELKKFPAVNSLEELSPGLTTSSPLKLHLTADRILFEVPYNLPDIKARNLGLALEWQGRMRQMFRHYLKKGYAVTDFWVAEEEGHLRSFYFLEKIGKPRAAARPKKGHSEPRR